MEEIAKRALLFDFYGPLLTKKQQEIYDLYYQHDLSLGEIAELEKVSRQAVFDLLHRAQQALQTYEARMGLVEKYLAYRKLLTELREEMAVREKNHATDFSRIRNLLEKLEKHW